MLLIDHSLVPGHIHAASLRRGSTIVAVDGPLTLAYRNASLDWLLPAAPMIVVALDEGDAHVVPYDTFVEMQTTGRTRASVHIECPSPRVAHAWGALLRTFSRWQKARPHGLNLDSPRQPPPEMASPNPSRARRRPRRRSESAR